MSDRIVLTLMAFVAVAMIGFAAIWPQGLGARSPGPFGHFPVEQTPAMQAAMARATAKAAGKAKAATEATAAAKKAAARTVPTPSPLAANAKANGLRPGL